MSDPLSSRKSRLIYNSLLLAASGWAARKLDPEGQPFALAACMVGGVAAVLGLLRVFLGPSDGYFRYRNRDSEELNSGRELRLLGHVSQTMLELVPLPLINMELYRHSVGLRPIVLAHGICVLPLLFDLRCSIVKQRKNCQLTETLRDLSTLGNIISLAFLACVERNYLYTRMAVTMLVIKYYPVIMDSAQEEAGEDLIICGTALFLHLFGQVPAQWAAQ